MSQTFDRYLKKARGILDNNWTGSYTKPSPALYPHQWNWDTGFIAIGKAHYDQPGAMAELDSLFSAQWGSGMLPHIIFDPDSLGHYFPEPDFWQTERSPHAPTDRHVADAVQDADEGGLLGGRAGHRGECWRPSVPPALTWWQSPAQQCSSI